MNEVPFGLYLMKRVEQRYLGIRIRSEQQVGEEHVNGEHHVPRNPQVTRIRLNRS